MRRLITAGRIGRRCNEKSEYIPYMAYNLIWLCFCCCPLVIEKVERIYLANFYVDDLPLYFEIGKPSQNTVEVKTVPQIYVHQR